MAGWHSLPAEIKQGALVGRWSKAEGRLKAGSTAALLLPACPVAQTTPPAPLPPPPCRRRTLPVPPPLARFEDRSGLPPADDSRGLRLRSTLGFALLPPSALTFFTTGFLAAAGQERVGRGDRVRGRQGRGPRRLAVGWELLPRRPKGQLSAQPLSSSHDFTLPPAEQLTRMAPAAPRLT